MVKPIHLHYCSWGYLLPEGQRVSPIVMLDPTACVEESVRCIIFQCICPIGCVLCYLNVNFIS